MRRRRVLVRGTLGVALAAVVFFVVVPRIASYGSIGSRLAAVSTSWALVLAGGAILDILVTALPWRVLLPQLSGPAALGFTQASTAVTAVVPGGAPLGMAVSFGLLRRLRVGGGEAAFAVGLAGIWSQVMIFVYPLAGAVLVLGTGHLSGTTLAIALGSGAAAAIVVLVAVAAFRSARVARRLGERFVRLRDERLLHLRSRWPALTAATVVNHLSGYLLLVLTLRAVGVPFRTLPLSETFLAWSIGRVISSLPLTPAGIGVVELGLIGALVGFGGPHALVVAAVLLYRALIVVPTLVVGFASLLALRYGSASTTSSRGSS
ncbi:MAG TPA: lysylphosphatidylglycerol synthase transmembrane domain-containing protein [Gaiellaceae bacterium]|nr:lysylphosphatidylglycerol synthase transmembrane domain-containing protein [Gaiellaceae bacterium]